MLWCSEGFGFVTLSDAFTTGSSIMPQKRNPDAAELVRAKTGRLNGSLVALLTVMKSLPLAYGKDMQEDKVPVFEAFDALELALAATAGMVRDMAARSRPDARGRRARLFDRDRSRRLARPRRRPAVPRGASRDGTDRRAGRASRLHAGANCRLPTCRRSSPRSRRASSTCSTSSARSPAAPVSAARHPTRCGPRSPRRGEGSCDRPPVPSLRLPRAPVARAGARRLRQEKRPGAAAGRTQHLSATLSP